MIKLDTIAEWFIRICFFASIPLTLVTVFIFGVVAYMEMVSMLTP